MITIFPTYLFILRKQNLWDPVFPFGIFSQEKLPQFSRELIYNDTFTKLSLFNIMKHGESDLD